MTITKGQRLGILDNNNKLSEGLEHIFEVVDNPATFTLYGLTDSYSNNSNRLNPEYKVVILKIME